MTRGEVWWGELAENAGFRPVAVVSRSDKIARRYSVTIAEITRVRRGLPSEVSLTQAEGMPVDCVINTDNLYTIPKDRLREHILTLSDEQLFAIAAALRYSLELDW